MSRSQSDSPEASPPTDLFPRISTGNPQADSILAGGFPSNSINIVMGQAGTGKTIFAEQLLFHNAGPDRPSLVDHDPLAALTKVVSYVQRFKFFEAEKVGTDIRYHDLGAALAAEGPEVLVPWLRQRDQGVEPQAHRH